MTTTTDIQREIKSMITDLESYRDSEDPLKRAWASAGQSVLRELESRISKGNDDH